MIDMSYLNNTQKIVRWRIVAGPPVEYIQTYDVLFDDNDFKIRQLEIPPRTVPQDASRIELEARGCVISSGVVGG